MSGELCHEASSHSSGLILTCHLACYSLAADIVNPKLWGETAMAAAWMPSSFYQEYVRTQKTVEGGEGGRSGGGRGKSRRSTLQMMEAV